MAMLRMWRSAMASCLVLLGAAAAGVAIGLEPQTRVLLEIDPDRSLLVREPDLLGGLRFGAVMERLADSAGVGDAGTLFRQWWSTLGEGPDAQVEAGLACPRPTSSVRPPTLNAFPMLCDSYLASIASFLDPFTEAGGGPFLVIGAVNRVDLIAQEAYPRDCGEFRLVIADNPDWPDWPEYRPNERLQVFVNFEAVVPNPPGARQFCLAIQKFWANLSDPGGVMSSDAAAADALRRFFLEGGSLTLDGELLNADALDGRAFALQPVISADNLGGDEAHRRGQVRINTRTAHGRVLREFEFREIDGAMRLVAVPAKGSPDASLFEPDAPGGGALAAVLRARSALLASSIDGFDFMPRFTGAEASQWVIPLHGMPEALFSYGEILGNEPWASDAIRDSIRSLAATPVALTAPNIVKRLEVLSCAGCHRHVRGARAGFIDDTGRTVKWPPSIRFTHMLPELDDSGRYAISDALACVLLPQRERKLRQLLGAIDPTPHDPADTERCRAYFE